MPLLVTSAAGANGHGHGALLAFDLDGRPRRTFSDGSRITDPRGLAVDREEGLLFLNSGADRVLALDRDGRVLRDTGPIGGLNLGGGNFGPDGRYYVGCAARARSWPFQSGSTRRVSMSCRPGSCRFLVDLLSIATAGCSSPPASARTARATRASSCSPPAVLCGRRDS